MPLDNLEHNMVLHRYGNLITTKDRCDGHQALSYCPALLRFGLLGELLSHPRLD